MARGNGDERLQMLLERTRFTHPLVDAPLVRPSYDGYGIVNLPWTALEILGVPPEGTPLAAELIPDELREGIRVVVLLIVDALGYFQLRSAVEAGDAPAVAALWERGSVFPLTSVFPATTAAALTALQTGVPASQHGMVGYTCYLREYGMLSNMIRFGPVGRFDSFASAGSDPHAFLPVLTISERAMAAGVAVEQVNYRSFQRSSLTRIHAPDIPYRAYTTLGEFGTVIRHALAAPGRRLIYAYWPMIDLIGHKYGPEGEASVAEVRLLDHMLQRELFDAIRHDDVLLILTADHGQVQLDLSKVTSLNDRPELLAELRVPPGGERRVTYFYPWSGREQIVRTLVEELAGDEGMVFTGAELLAQGLYGPGPIYHEVPHRVGDLVLIARGPASFPYGLLGESTDPMLGAHAALEPEEMLVPCAIWRR